VKKNKIPISKTHKKLIETEWNYEKNNKIELYPTKLTYGSAKKAWWTCNKKHEWKDTIWHRCAEGRGCPYCAGYKICKDNCLLTTNPELIKEWDYEKNNKLELDPTKLTYGSNKKAWWKCNNGHEWKAFIPHRTIRNQNCPYCCGQKACKDNCLSTTNLELIKEWNYKKNNKLGLFPTKLTHGSRKKIWWRCKNGHEWKASCYSRITGSGCPYCCGQKVCKDNCLSTTNPKLAKEWHPTKNGKLTPQNATPGSDKKVWWTCKNGHEWKAVIGSRSRGAGCPKCAIINVTGKNNSNYNPNLTDKDRIDRRKLPEYREWRKKVYIKGNFTCQICNVRGGTINAHHLMGYRKNPKLRFKENNGITLCTNCHKKFHKMYGRGNNTSQQFEEFKKYKNNNILSISA